MADEILIFDATGSNPDGSNPGSPLQVGPGTSYGLLAHSYPAPALAVTYSSSVDTEGENAVARRHQNRVITIQLDMVDATDALLKALQAKFAKLQAEGGTLKRTMKNGDVRIYDIVAGDAWDPVFDLKYVLGDLAEVTMTLPARPYARGTEQDLGDNTETTLPALVFTEASIPGDVAALGRLVIDNDVAADQWWAIWGVENNSRYDTTQSSAALFYEAEGRTALGGSATAAGPSGASGGGSNVMRNTALTTNYVSILSTQASGGGAHLTHIGNFRVFARFQVATSAAGSVSVGLEWSEGDFRRPTRNPVTTLDSSLNGTWVLVDLGIVNVTKPLVGSQRWEGRIIAKSTATGDDIDIDWLMLVPVDYASGEVSGVIRPTTPTAFSVRDEFDQSAGALTGKTLPSGGTWSGAGDADDFAVETTGKTAQRVAISDAGGSPVGTGRWVRAGSAMTNTQVQVDFKRTANPSSSVLIQGVFARYVDTSNFVMAYINPGSGPLGETTINWVVNVAGTVAAGDTNADIVTVDDIIGSWYTLRLAVDAGGRITVWFGPQGRVSDVPIFHIRHADAATGGTLASGTCGFYDGNLGSTAITRNYDNFAVGVHDADAAVFASQSLQISHSGVVREDSTGSYWTKPSSYEGDYLRVPPSGAEAYAARAIVKLSRNEPTALPDSATDDLSARLFVTPRYL